MMQMSLKDKMLMITLLLSVLFSCAQSEGSDEKLRIFVSDATKGIFVLPLNGSQCEEHKIVHVDSPAATTGVDYDPEEGKIYWPEALPQSIKRANVDGTEISVVSSSLKTYLPRGLAVDSVERKLFYTGLDTSVIGGMDLTGENAQIIHDSKRVQHPIPIAVDETKRKLFWADRFGGDRIASSDYDGTNLVKIVSTGGSSQGLALDKENQIIYYCGSQFLESISYGGTNRREINNFGETYFGIFFLNDILYLGMFARRLHQMPVDSDEMTEILSSTRFDNPYGLYVLSDTFKGSGCTDTTTTTTESTTETTTETTTKATTEATTEPTTKVTREATPGATSSASTTSSTISALSAALMGFVVHLYLP